MRLGCYRVLDRRGGGETGRWECRPPPTTPQQHYSYTLRCPTRPQFFAAILAVDILVFLYEQIVYLQSQGGGAVISL